MHKKKLDQKRLESSSTAAPSEADHLTFGPETHLHMLEVTPREDLAAIGNAARLIQRAFRKHRGIGVALAAPWTPTSAVRMSPYCSQSGVTLRTKSRSEFEVMLDDLSKRKCVGTDIKLLLRRQRNVSHH